MTEVTAQSHQELEQELYVESLVHHQWSKLVAGSTHQRPNSPSTSSSSDQLTLTATTGTGRLPGISANPQDTISPPPLPTSKLHRVFLPPLHSELGPAHQDLV